MWPTPNVRSARALRRACGNNDRDPARVNVCADARRLRGLRANASTKSHAELDEAKELDDGNPAELGAQYRSLLERLPHLAVLGGCCGTDQRHIAAIASACIRRRAA